MVVDVTGMNDSSYESLEELFVDKDTKALLSKWKTSNESGKTKEFETSMITDEEYMKLKEVFKVLHSETEDYSKYRKAFNALCKAAHIVPDGTIIIKYELSKGKDDDRNNLYVKYAENTRPITLPEGTKLYHQSVVGGIKELIPKWKLRGKNEAGYLCDKPRVYLTMSKSLPRISTDNKLKDRLYSYEVVNTPAKVFVDPLLPDIFQKAVYVETETPIPVKPLKSDTILGKIKEKITGDKEEKEEDKKVSEMVVDVTNKEPVNEVSAAVVAGGVATAALIGQIVYGLLKWKKDKKKSEEDKKLEAFYNKHPSVKKATNELFNFGEKVGEAVASHLRNYAKENKFIEKYPMFVMSHVKYDPVNTFDVQVSEYQNGLNEEVLAKWEAKNPGKDWSKSKDPELSRDWYFDLLTEGENAAKKIFNDLNKDGKFRLNGVDTGDGDEGHVYIDIKLSTEWENNLRAEVKKDYESSNKNNVNESVESVNEVFGLSKEEKEKKAADRKALSDLEFSYDKKYNAFCLSVSGYSIEKLQNMLDKKASELEDAKAEKKSAEDRQKKLEAQIKIDYLENVCNRCKAMIKKKKSYHNK